MSTIEIIKRRVESLEDLQADAFQLLRKNGLSEEKARARVYALSDMFDAAHKTRLNLIEAEMTSAEMYETVSDVWTTLYLAQKRIVEKIQALKD